MPFHSRGPSGSYTGVTPSDTEGLGCTKFSIGLALERTSEGDCGDREEFTRVVKGQGYLVDRIRTEEGTDGIGEI